MQCLCDFIDVESHIDWDILRLLVKVFNLFKYLIFIALLFGKMLHQSIFHYKLAPFIILPGYFISHFHEFTERCHIKLLKFGVATVFDGGVRI